MEQKLIEILTRLKNSLTQDEKNAEYDNILSLYGNFVYTSDVRNATAIFYKFKNFISIDEFIEYALTKSYKTYFGAFKVITMVCYLADFETFKKVYEKFNEQNDMSNLNETFFFDISAIMVDILKKSDETELIQKIEYSLLKMIEQIMAESYNFRHNLIQMFSGSVANKNKLFIKGLKLSSFDEQDMRNLFDIFSSIDSNYINCSSLIIPDVLLYSNTPRHSDMSKEEFDDMMGAVVATLGNKSDAYKGRDFQKKRILARSFLFDALSEDFNRTIDSLFEAMKDVKIGMYSFGSAIENLSIMFMNDPSSFKQYNAKTFLGHIKTKMNLKDVSTIDITVLYNVSPADLKEAQIEISSYQLFMNMSKVYGFDDVIEVTHSGRKESIAKVYFKDAFATEEQILKNPEYFDILVVKGAKTRKYVSEKTFNVLRKFHSKRTAYNSDFSDPLTIFKTILNDSTPRSYFTDDNFKYLLSKGLNSSDAFEKILDMKLQILNTPEIDKTSAIYLIAAMYK